MKMHATLARTGLILVLGAAIAGCPLDPDDSKDASIAIALSAPAVTIAQGATGTVNVTVTRSDFSGEVTLTADGLPTGVTAAFVPASLSDGTTTSTLTLSVAASAAPGDVGLTIKASGADVAEKTQPLTLTVSVAGSYTLSMTPASRTVTQGSSATATVNVNRTGGFAGDVALVVSGAPSGLTATLSPATATGTNSTLTLTATNSAAVGTSTLTITGTSPGLANQTTTISVTVQAATTLTAVSFPLCFDGGNLASLLWVGYRNEGGAWTQLTPSASGAVSFNATPKVMVRVVFSSGGGGSSFFSNDLMMITAAELQQFPQACPQGVGTKTMNYSVGGLSAGVSADVHLGWAGSTITHPTTSSSLNNVQDGALDLFASRGTISGGQMQPNALIIRRGLNLANGATIPVLDFGAAEALTPSP